MLWGYRGKKWLIMIYPGKAFGGGLRLGESKLGHWQLSRELGHCGCQSGWFQAEKPALLALNSWESAAYTAGIRWISANPLVCPVTLSPGSGELLAPAGGGYRLVLPQQEVWTATAVFSGDCPPPQEGWPQRSHLPLWLWFSLQQKEDAEVSGRDGPFKVQGFWNPRKGVKEGARRFEDAGISWLLGVCSWT